MAPSAGGGWPDLHGPERLDLGVGSLRAEWDSCSGGSGDQEDPDQVGGREARPGRWLLCSWVPVGQAAGPPQVRGQGRGAWVRRLWLGLPTAGQGPSIPPVHSPPTSVGIWAFLWCLRAWMLSRVLACAYVCVSDPVCVFLGVGVPASLGVCAHACVPRAVCTFLGTCACVHTCVCVCVPTCTVSVGL